MKKTPTLSIIMPVYNTESYIHRSIQSVINQSFKDFELIIVNDGSSDNSLSVAQDICKGYKNVQIINLDKNYGAGYARNIGLSIAKGNIIGFIDSDDWIDTNFYSILLENMARNDSNIAIAGIQNEYYNGKTSSQRYVYKYENIINSNFALELLAKIYNTDIYITPIVNNKIYRRELFNHNKIRFEEQSYYEDDLITFWLLYFAKSISITSLTKYHYLQRESSIMHTFSNKHIDDLFSSFIKLKEEVYGVNDENLKAIYYRYFEKCFSALITNLFNLEKDETLQKYFFKSIVTQLRNNFEVSEIIDNIDLNFVKHLFL